MTQASESTEDDFWDREALLAQRENALFAIEDELRCREEILLEREAALGAMDAGCATREAILVDRELTLRETEALLDARARVLNTAQAHAGAPNLEALQATALDLVQKQFDERETKLKAAESSLLERVAFIEKSEDTVSEKGQQLQEWQVELEHLQDELSSGILFSLEKGSLCHWCLVQHHKRTEQSWRNQRRLGTEIGSGRRLTPLCQLVAPSPHRLYLVRPT